MKKCVTVIAAGVLFVGTIFAGDYPKVETFLGYSYVRANNVNQNAGLGQAIGGFDMNGGSGQFIYNFNKWISGVADIGAYNKPNVGIVNVQDTTATFLFGPRISYRNKSRFTPYGQVLFGVAYRAISTRVGAVTDLTAPVLPVVGEPSGLFPGPLQPITARLTDSQSAFALAAGAGLDIRINKHFSFRPVSVDYVLTRFPSLSTGSNENQNSLRASAGVIFTFGGEQPAPAPQPQTKTCPDGKVVLASAPCPKQNTAVSLTANPLEVCQGESAQVDASIAGGDKSQMSLAWSVNGQTVSQDPSFVFSTTGREPGTYQVEVTVHGPNLNPASAATTITVKPYMPPTGTAQASPAQVYVGEKFTLSASCSGQCGGPIQAPTFTASDGSVQGDQFDSSSVQFDPSSNAEQRKTVTITASCADSRSVGTATTQIEVIRKATIAPVRLPDVMFHDNSARVNNCGKRILLEHLKSYYDRDTTGTVVLVGHSSPDETAANLAAQRAMNAAAVITGATGVCLSIPQSQVQVSSPGVDQNGVPFDSSFCGPSVGAGSSSSADMRRVVVWFVPSGGQLPTSAANTQSAAALNVSSLGCPK
jgi:hypothetical protein